MTDPAGPLTPEMQARVLELAAGRGSLGEHHVAEALGLNLPRARVGLAALAGQGRLVRLSAHPVRYAPAPRIDVALVREDLMQGVRRAVFAQTSTVDTLAALFGVEPAVMDATVRAMQVRGDLTVTMIGRAAVCRLPSPVEEPAPALPAPVSAVEVPVPEALDEDVIPPPGAPLPDPLALLRAWEAAQAGTPVLAALHGQHLPAWVRRDLNRLTLSFRSPAFLRRLIGGLDPVRGRSRGEIARTWGQPSLDRHARRVLAEAVVFGLVVNGVDGYRLTRLGQRYLEGK